MSRIFTILSEIVSGFRPSDRSTCSMALSDPAIFRILMKSRVRISAAAWLVVHDAQAAEDIFQNVALKSLTKEVLFDTEGSVLSWAFITARREGIDWLHRRQRESIVLETEILDVLDREWTAEAVDGQDASLAALRECLNTMPEKSRQLLRLRYFDGHGCQEVAEQLGAGLAAVYKRLSRVHRELKTCVETRLSASEEA